MRDVRVRREKRRECGVLCQVGVTFEQRRIHLEDPPQVGWKALHQLTQLLAGRPRVDVDQYNRGRRDRRWTRRRLRRNGARHAQKEDGCGNGGSYDRHVSLTPRYGAVNERLTAGVPLFLGSRRIEKAAASPIPDSRAAGDPRIARITRIATRRVAPGSARRVLI